LFVGSKKISGGRMSLQHNKPKNSSKQGAEVFGCHIPQSIISHAKEYIRKNKEWDPAVFTSELYYTTINTIAYDRIENLVSRDKNGEVLATALEELLECMVKTNQVKISDSMKYSGLLQRLRTLATPKIKKRSVEQGFVTPIKKRQKNLLPVYDQECDDMSQETNKSVCSEVEKSPAKDDNSEYEFDTDGNEDANDQENEDPDIISLPPTPTYRKKTSRVTKVVKPVPEKKVPTITTEDSDSDSFDPVNDEDIGGYDPLGDILASTRRIVVRGANKCYYGVGPKPVSTVDTKSRVKMSANTPSPGDIGNITSCMYLNF
jgi:hypothetical protein